MADKYREGMVECGNKVCHLTGKTMKKMCSYFNIVTFNKEHYILHYCE